jgi:hypothetical protein
MAKKKNNIHKSIKECLGYDPTISDKEFLADWKERSTQVCKPCWELKYCPYGPFVEQSPLLPTKRANALAHQEHLQRILATGKIGTADPLTAEARGEYSALVAQAKKDPRILVPKVALDLWGKEIARIAEEENKSLLEYLEPPTSDFEKYRVPFPLGGKRELEDELPEEILAAVEGEIRRMEIALETGIDDQQKSLDPARRKLFEKEVKDFDSDAYPEEIPDVVAELQCNNFGHICPVVFVGEDITETTETRRRGRYIPFQTKMRVVRRDNYTCQNCGTHLKDDEVEFDHIIPHAKGGSCEEHNIRLTCFTCNRDKSDTVEI